MNKNNASAPLPPPPPVGLAALTDLALDLRWAWNHSSDELWRRLDLPLWEQTSHPCAVLKHTSPAKLAAALADPSFCALIDQLIRAKRECEAAPAWFQRTHADAPLTCVAYFCMEFMLSEALPIYSGGLGNVAGDQLKAASDLGVPVIGVGLLYRHGYFHQVIDADGAQQALFPANDPANLPVTPVRRADGEWLRLEIALPHGTLWLRIWQVQVGRTKLYLLDSNDPANAPEHQLITGELYGGDPEMRLRQEMVLGLGGCRMLAALGLKPDVYHLNEGHTALVVLERARAFMVESGQPFAVALAATRVGTIFTTHTAVAAGFDRFAPSLVEHFLGRYAHEHLGLSLRALLALGRQNPDDDAEPFNLAYLAVRGSGAVNGVSRLHGRVSRHLFSPLFPRWPENEVPVGHVTNGVHMPTWDSAAADQLWTDACGKGRWLGLSTSLEADLRRVPDETLWTLRNTSRAALIDYTRDRIGRQMTVAGATAAAIARTQARLNPGVLTLGFARRFATYKRPNLLLHDPARLIRLLSHPQHPAQLIFAGKAHPADRAGQALIQEWMHFIGRHETNPPVVFLADYDMLLAEHLVQGVDVWINTPQRPWEASGTSGMKVLVNGGLNLSELDGWWAEAYLPDVGWSLGDGQERGDDPAWDRAEAEALYLRLEQEVIPEFYARNAAGLPTAWLARVRESMARLTPKFSASRTVRDYTEQHYLPAALALRARTAGRGATAEQRVVRENTLQSHWAGLRFGTVTVTSDATSHRFDVTLRCDAASRAALRVELYAEGANGDAAVHCPLAPETPGADEAGWLTYRANVPAGRPSSDFTARVVSDIPGLLVPLEASAILWQK